MPRRCPDGAGSLARARHVRVVAPASHGARGAAREKARGRERDRERERERESQREREARARGACQWTP